MGVGRTKKKVGLALGGGAARGFAHIGVLEALEEEGIPIDMVAGTSAGAAIGALYAQGKRISEIKKLTLGIGWKQLFSLVDLTLSKTGFIEGRKIIELLRSNIGDIEFKDLKLPLACIATDIMTGEEVVIDQGRVVEGVRASISLPLIFTPAKWKGKYLIDGGLVNPVPVSVVKRMGADFVIAVNPVPNFRARFQQRENRTVPNMFGILIQSMYIGTYSLIGTNLEAADVIIEPYLVHIGFGDFHRAEECISLGKKAAKHSIASIKKRLET